MSERGIDFANKWIRENVTSATYPASNDPHAERYAEELREAAAAAGISIEEMEEDLGDLDDYVLDQMDEMTDDELQRHLSKDNT